MYSVTSFCPVSPRAGPPTSCTECLPPPPAGSDRTPGRARGPPDAHTTPGRARGPPAAHTTPGRARGPPDVHTTPGRARRPPDAHTTSGRARRHIHTTQGPGKTKSCGLSRLGPMGPRVETHLVFYDGGQSVTLR